MARGQGSAALSGRVISPPDRSCQRLLSTNRRTNGRIGHGEEVSIFKDFAPYLSHNPATFWHYVSTESQAARGAAGVQLLKGSAISDGHLACSLLLENIERFARHCCSRFRPAFWPLIPEHRCGTPCSRISPSEGEYGFKDERRSRRLLREFGGTVG